MASETYALLDEHLTRAMEESHVFFVGAGVCVPSGLPTFQEINQRLIATISQGDVTDGDAKLLSKTLRPEVVYQAGLDELGPNVLLSMEVLEEAEPNTYHFLLAEALRRGCFVFTTNVDVLTEKACQQVGLVPGQHFDICHGRSDDQDFKDYLQRVESDSPPRPCLFKLHGSIDLIDPRSKYATIQFALRQVGRGLYEPRRRILEYFHQRYVFWFLGYSCRDDFSVFPAFVQSTSEKDSFWFDYDSGPLAASLLGTDRSRWELEKEEMKPLTEQRDQGIINIHELLSRRGAGYRFRGDPGKWLEDACTNLGIPVTSPSIRMPSEMTALGTWARQLPAWRRRLFVARLFDEAGRWDKAVEFCKRAGEDPSCEEGVWSQKLADIYYKDASPEASEKALKLYQSRIESLPPGHQRASIKSSMANVLRRRGRDWLDEAFEAAADAISEFESTADEPEREADLAYARCLNIYGLAQYGRNQFEDARALFEDSIRLKRQLGDVDGIAESENALSLAWTQEGRDLIGRERPGEARERFVKAAEHASEALDARRRIGNLRGYAQNCRNFAWSNAEVMKLSVEEAEKQECFAKARDGYLAGIRAWRRTDPPPPTEIVLFSNLLVGLYIDFCRGTVLPENKTRWALEGLAVYRGLLDDLSAKEQSRTDSRRPRAHENLTLIREMLEEAGLRDEVQEADVMLKGVEVS